MLTALALGTALCSAASSAARWAPAVGAVIWRSPRRRMSCLRTAGCVLQQTADCLTHGRTDSCSPPRGWGGHGALVQALLNVGIMRPKGALLQQPGDTDLPSAQRLPQARAQLPLPAQSVCWGKADEPSANSASSRQFTVYSCKSKRMFSYRGKIHYLQCLNSSTLADMI